MCSLNHQRERKLTRMPSSDNSVHLWPWIITMIILTILKTANLKVEIKLPGQKRKHFITELSLKLEFTRNDRRWTLITSHRTPISTQSQPMHSTQIGNRLSKSMAHSVIYLDQSANSTTLKRMPLRVYTFRICLKLHALTQSRPTIVSWTGSCARECHRLWGTRQVVVVTRSSKSRCTWSQKFQINFYCRSIR